MYCPNCGYENRDNARFCKKCGTMFNATPNNNVHPSNNHLNSSNNNLLIIGITVIIIIAIIAGTVIFLSNDGFTSQNSLNNISEQNNTNNQNSTQADNSNNNGLKIISGTFTTGSPLPAKTYITVNVGEKHAGENVKIRVFYTHDGSKLNAGNIVPMTVDNTGHFTMNTLNSLNHYPDHASITLYDGDGNIVDTMEVDMEPTSGLQYF